MKHFIRCMPVLAGLLVLSGCAGYGRPYGGYYGAGYPGRSAMVTPYAAAPLGLSPMAGFGMGGFPSYGGYGGYRVHGGFRGGWRHDDD